MRRYTSRMGGSSSQGSHEPVSGDGGDDGLDPTTRQGIATPGASSYLALAVALLAAATLLAVATIGVPGTIVHIHGVAAMLTSALSTLMAAGALLALRSARAARRRRI